MRTFLSDCRHALRLYRRTPGSSVIAIVVLVSGIGVVGAFISLYVDLTLKARPGIDDDGRLVTLSQSNGVLTNMLPFGFVDRISEELTSAEFLVGFSNWSALSVGREGETVAVEIASQGFFDGIRPNVVLGRGFEPAEHDRYAEPVVVISFDYWRERYDGRMDALGETIEFFPPQAGEETEPTEFQIVGVMAPELQGVMYDTIDLWVPLERFVTFSSGNDDETYDRIRRQSLTRVLGRLRPDAPAQAFAREVESRFGESAGEDYGLTRGFRIDVLDGVVREPGVHRDAVRQLELLLAGSVLLALTAAANTSLFLLARAPGRRRELAIRQSVGAPIKRLARQLITESALLVVTAGVLGVFISILLAHALSGVEVFRAADWKAVTMLDWRVLGMLMVVLSVLASLISLAPILGLKGLSLDRANRRITSRASLAQRIAGSVQIAVAATFGGAAIALAWFLGPIAFGDPGYETVNRHAFEFIPPFSFDPTTATTTSPDAERQRGLMEAIPGVRTVTFIDVLPAWQSALEKIQARDPSDPSRDVDIAQTNIDSRSVDVLGFNLLYGHVPGENETTESLVNQALASRLFGRDDVIGETLELRSGRSPGTQIVGVLEDLSFIHPAAAVEPMVFTNRPPPAIRVRGVIESSLSSADLRRALQNLAQSGELEFGAPRVVRPLRELRSALLAPDTARSQLTFAGAGLVVLLAAFGFYGTQSYLVAAGRREFAIRASLGASPKVLGRLVFWRGLLLSMPGLALGALLSFIVVVWLRNDFLSHDIDPGIVTIAVAIGLTVFLSLASLGPARLAMRSQPAPLLREV